MTDEAKEPEVATDDQAAAAEPEKAEPEQSPTKAEIAKAEADLDEARRRNEAAYPDARGPATIPSATDHTHDVPA